MIRWGAILCAEPRFEEKRKDGRAPMTAERKRATSLAEFRKKESGPTEGVGIAMIWSVFIIVMWTVMKNAFIDI